jgi:hypothetical protein
MEPTEQDQNGQDPPDRPSAIEESQHHFHLIEPCRWNYTRMAIKILDNGKRKIDLTFLRLPVFRQGPGGQQSVWSGPRKSGEQRPLEQRGNPNSLRSRTGNVVRTDLPEPGEAPRLVQPSLSGYCLQSKSERQTS